MTPEEIAEKIKEQNKQIRERNDSDIKKLLKIPEFRRFGYRLLQECGTFGMGTRFAREVGLMVFSDIMRLAPESYLQMDREYKSEQVSFKKQIPVDPDEDS